MLIVTPVAAATINVTWDSAWLVQSMRGDSARLTALRYLINTHIPQAVAVAISLTDQDLPMVDPGNLRVRAEPFGSLSYNLSSLWVEILCEEREGTPEWQSTRRRTIATLVQWQISSFYHKLSPLIETPDYDIECRTIRSSGMMVSTNGAIAELWG